MRYLDHAVLGSCLPPEEAHFHGRQKECEAILGHLTGSKSTRVVDICGFQGFGKTSVAITIAHRLREKMIPVYFVPLRGVRSTDELVAKLLSFFSDLKQVPRLFLFHRLIQCLQKVQNPFVLILDQADDLLESGDIKSKETFLKFLEDILAEIPHIKLLFTTRESLDYLRHNLFVAIHLERIGKLDEESSVNLVEALLPEVLRDNCRRIVEKSGQVPLTMRKMCASIIEEYALND